MKRKGQVTGRNLRVDRRVMNEETEELGRSIGNDRVSGDAAISVSKLNLVNCGEVTVGTSEVVVRHNLGQVPSLVIITMTSTGSVWQNGRATEQVVKVIADSSSRTARVWVGA